MIKNRDEWIDAAKGFGILLVVYGHVARGLHSAGIFHEHEIFKAIDNAVYAFHMPLFFFYLAFCF
jgi:fucose 4-O-acetylase-like acetyltransferase